MKTFCLFLILVSSTAWAQKKVAIVKLIRGEASALAKGKVIPLKVDDWVETGSIIKTSDKSFIKLVFIDKSQMNIGPKSEMKIEQFSGKDSGVIDLVKGKIRSQVTKDYLQMDKNKSKLFIKTANAVMGVRGTDFMISTNGKNTATVLFEGEIVFNKLSQPGKYSTDNLERIVDRGMRLFPGEFSVVERERQQPTVPSLLNIQQRDALEKNVEMSLDQNSGNAKVEPRNSVVPEGLDGKTVSNESQTLKSEMTQVATVKNDSSASLSPDGYVNGGQVKPANGSFVHIETGIIIPPGPGSVLDRNSNTYIPGQEMGKVAPDGSYTPPKDIEITYEGKIMVTVTNSAGTAKIQEIQAPVPVVDSNVSLAKMNEFLAQNPTLINTQKVITNDIIGKFTPRGILDISGAVRPGANDSGGITPNTFVKDDKGESPVTIQVNRPEPNVPPAGGGGATPSP